MCGFVGIFDIRETREVDEALLSRMNQTQVHRGPDDTGVYKEPGLGLGHRRLSIIDLSGGRQPLFNEDGSVVVVFNGEIYNFQDLTNELVIHGHRFHTRCDTEVIVHAWEQWGEKCVEHFRGMFAFALWDRNQQTLFLARDRLGIKPLFYALLPDGHLIFASELKALLAHCGLPRETDPCAVEDYFAYGYIPEPRTILRHAAKLPPGHTITLRRGRPLPAANQYWDLPFTPLGPLSEAQAGEELISRLREAVKIRLIADVPLGAFLSGGVDSSAVVALMADSSDNPVNTCSISFSDPRYNEALYAAQVAERYGTNHYVKQVDSHDFELIDRLASLYDEPFADSSALPTYRICELARKHVTVVLSGDGGDENLAGYRRYRWHMHEERIRSLLPQPLRQCLFGLLGRTYPKADWAPKMFRAKATFEAIARDSLQGYFHSVSVLDDALRKRLFTDKFRGQLQGYSAIEVLQSYANRAPTDHPLALVQYLDMKTYLPGDILTKVDRASMAHSLEVRVPILDHKLVEWISGLPPEFKLNRGQGKYIFKKTLESYLPRDILYRRKMGFGVPLASWFRGPLREVVQRRLMDSTFTDSGIFSPTCIREIVAQHQSGRRDNSVAIWALFVYACFQRRVLHEKSVTSTG